MADRLVSALPGADDALATTLAALRRHTERMHRELDERMRPISTRDGYVAYLTGMGSFMQATGCAVPMLTTRLQPRLSALRDDLHGLGGTLVLEHRHHYTTTSAETLGWEYVFSGSTLGARQLRRIVRTSPFATGNHAFLDLHCAADDWPRFLQAAAQIAPDQRVAVCAGALAAFACAHRAFQITRTPIWN